MSDYLWDGEGDDAEVAHLEALLSPLGYRGKPPSLPPPRRGRAVWMAAAGVAAFAALIALVVWRSPRPATAGWAMTMESATGRPSEGTLAVGAWLETGEHRARLRVAGIGTVELMPGTRARIVESGGERQVLRLDHGTLSAVVTAPPRHFIVETPHATAVDLGCAFTLSVDESGRGKLSVSAGAVALAAGAAPEVVVPAGSECAISERGPGTPYVANAREGKMGAPGTGTGTQTQTQTRTRTQPKKTQTQTQTQTRTAPPQTKPATAPPQTKPAAPSTNLRHDSLKDLDRSIP